MNAKAASATPARTLPGIDLDALVANLTPELLLQLQERLAAKDKAEREEKADKLKEQIRKLEDEIAAKTAKRDDLQDEVDKLLGTTKKASTSDAKPGVFRDGSLGRFVMELLSDGVSRTKEAICEAFIKKNPTAEPKTVANNLTTSVLKAPHTKSMPHPDGGLKKLYALTPEAMSAVKG